MDEDPEAGEVAGDCTQQRIKRLRVYLACTPDDTDIERTYLTREIYPQIYDFCAARDVECSLLDPHTGLSHQHKYQDKFRNLWDDELDKCLTESTDDDAVCFVCLLTDNYGDTSLPSAVEAEEFEIIASGIQGTLTKEKVREWYRKDLNSLPPRYVLQPVTKELLQLTENLQVSDDIPLKWKAAEAEMMTHLQMSALRSDTLGETETKRWLSSDMEKTISDVITKHKSKLLKTAICIQREIVDFAKIDLMDPAGKETISKYIRLREGRGKFEVDECAQAQKERLKDRVKESGMTVECFSESWSAGGLTAETHWEYLQQLGATFYNAITASLETGLDEGRPPHDHYADEADYHVNLGERLAGDSIARKDIAARITRYLSDPEADRPLILTGSDGSGKSTVIAQTARSAFGLKPVTAVTVTRYCGATYHSTVGRLLLQSLVWQISTAYGKQDADSSGSCEDLKSSLLRLMSLATDEQPLLILIDGIDRLDNSDYVKSNLSWIPVSLPNHCRVILSSSSDDVMIQHAMRLKNLPPANIISADGMGHQLIENMVTSALKGKNRKLQPEQMKQWLRAAKSKRTQEPSVMRTKLLVDAAANLPSYSRLPELPDTVRGLYQGFLSEMEERHGAPLVSLNLALLAVSRAGLTEEVLQDAASTDAAIRKTREVHPNATRLPRAFFHSFIRDMGEHLLETQCYGRIVWCFKNNQFLEAVKERYLSDDGDTLRNQRMLADYFSGKLAENHVESGLHEQPLFRQAAPGTDPVFNKQKLIQLPASLLATSDTEEFASLVCNPEFVAASCAAGTGYELLKTLQAANDHLNSDITREYARFLQEHIHTLTSDPRSILQVAAGEKATSLVRQHADTLQSATPWIANPPVIFRHITQPPDTHKLCSTSLGKAVLNSSVVALFKSDVSEKRKFMTVAHADGKVKIWEVDTFCEALCIDCRRPLTSAEQIPVNHEQFRLLISLEHTREHASDGYIKVYDVTLGGFPVAELLYTIAGPQHIQGVTSLGVLSDEETVVTSICQSDMTAVMEIWSVKHEQPCKKVSVNDASCKYGITRIRPLPGDDLLAVVGCDRKENSWQLVTYKTETLKETGSGFLSRNAKDYCLCLEVKTVEEKVWLILVSMRYSVSLLVINAKGKKVIVQRCCQHQVTEDDPRAAFYNDMIIICNKEVTTWSYPEATAKSWADIIAIESFDKVFTQADVLIHGYDTDVTSLILSGENIISGHQDGVVKLWQLPGGDGERDAETPHHTGPVNCCAVIPGTTEILTASGTDLWLWDVTAGTRSKCFTTGRRITGVAASAGDLPNEEPRQVALQSAEDDTVLFLPLSALREHQDGVLKGYTIVTLSTTNTTSTQSPSSGESSSVNYGASLQVSSDCKYLSALSSNPDLARTFCIVNLQWGFEYNKVIPVEEQEGEVRGAAFSPSSTWAISWCQPGPATGPTIGPATGSASGRLVLWDLNSLQPLGRSPDIVPHGAEGAEDEEEGEERGIYDFTCAAFMPGEHYTYLVGTSHGELQLRGLDTMDVMHKTCAHTAHVRHIHVTDDGEHVLTYGEDMKTRGDAMKTHRWVKVWRMPEMEEAGGIQLAADVTCTCMLTSSDAKVYLGCGHVTGQFTILCMDIKPTDFV